MGRIQPFEQYSHEPYIAVARFWLAYGDWYSVADISLYAYTHVAHEGAFDLAPYPAIRAWPDRVRAQPSHVTIDA
jgi:glutathione S-transferase